MYLSFDLNLCEMFLLSFLWCFQQYSMWIQDTSRTVLFPFCLKFLLFLSLFLQRVKSGREGSARGRREGREGSAGSAGESEVIQGRESPTDTGNSFKDPRWSIKTPTGTLTLHFIFGSSVEAQTWLKRRIWYFAETLTLNKMENVMVFLYPQSRSQTLVILYFRQQKGWVSNLSGSK